MIFVTGRGEEPFKSVRVEAVPLKEYSLKALNEELKKLNEAIEVLMTYGEELIAEIGSISTTGVTITIKKRRYIARISRSGKRVPGYTHYDATVKNIDGRYLESFSSDERPQITEFKKAMLAKYPGAEVVELEVR